MPEKKTELITQTEAAQLSGRTLAAINELVRRGTLRHEKQFGKRLVYRSEVEALDKNAKAKK